MTGIILAGGNNSRMGTPKAFLTINGTRLIDIILKVYCDIFSEIIIVTNEPLVYMEFSDAIIVADIYKKRERWAEYIPDCFTPIIIIRLSFFATCLS